MIPEGQAAKLARFGEYGIRFMAGLAVPQANANVEAEFARLLPAYVGRAVMRMNSPLDDSRERLPDYLRHLAGQARAQYAGMVIDALAVACTGSSYVLGRAAEQSACAAAEEAIGARVITATDAICLCLDAVGARKIALLAPYPEWLGRHATDYWTARGRPMGRLPFAGAIAGDTTGIYGLGPGLAQRALATVPAGEYDAVVLSGTGLPSLAAATDENEAVVLTSNLCLAATLVARAQGLEAPCAETLSALRSGLGNYASKEARFG